MPVTRFQLFNHHLGQGVKCRLSCKLKRTSGLGGISLFFLYRWQRDLGIGYSTS